MRIRYIEETIDVARLINNKSLVKRLTVAYKHDHTITHDIISRLGPKPSDSDVLTELVKKINQSLTNNTWGNLSQDGKLDDWMLNKYANHLYDWEDIDSVSDSLGQWKALSIRGLLKPSDQDLTQVANIQHLDRLLNRYQADISRIKSAVEIEQAKRTRAETVLIDNDEFWVAIPYNYGSCYVFNMGMGHSSNFCTGSSGGQQWFKRYAPEGPIVMIVHKPNMNDADGKWQLHAPTGQLVNSVQERRHDLHWNDQKFASLFPDLMYEILSAMNARKDEIEEASKSITPNGYDVIEQIELIKKKFPVSWDNPNNPIEQPPAR